MSARGDEAPGNAGTAGTVIVTATRTPAALQDSLASVTVISRRDIEARQATSIQELLQGEAGIEISNNGGLGKTSGVFMRGTGSGHVLVLVDGIELGSATLGTTAFQYLPVDSIDHIEIVRGPRSSLYGSEAIGGVIQIFTRAGQGPPRLAASAGGGSHGSQSYAGALTGENERLAYHFGATHLASEGYDSCRGAPFPPGGGCYTSEPDADGYRNTSFNARLGYRFSDAARIELHGLRAQGSSDFDSSFANRERFVQQALGVRAVLDPAEHWRVSVQSGQSRDAARDDLQGAFAGEFSTRRQQSSIQTDWSPALRHTVSLGLDHRRDRIHSDTPFAVTSRQVTGLFGQYQGGRGAQQWVLGARHDANSQFGTAVTGSVALAHALPAGLRLSASYGTAFKAPTFNDLYYPFFGNPALRPERSRSAELGLDWKSGAWSASLRGFATRVHDLVGFDARLFAPANIDRARIDGLEAQLRVGQGRWSAGATATWLNPRNATSGSLDEGHLLPRRARGTARLELARRWSRADLSARVHWVGRRFDDLANLAPLGGHVTADLLASWTLAPRWSVAGKIANLADHRYESALFYPADGRNAWVTLRYHAAP